MNQIENNKIIAEFVGIVFTKDNKANHPLISAPYPPIECYKYHTSWDWLMPVVENIETTVWELPIEIATKYIKDKYPKRSTIKTTLSIETIYDEREEFKGWTAYISGLYTKQIYTTERLEQKPQSKLESIYIVVVAFINWYNQQKN